MSTFNAAVKDVLTTRGQKAGYTTKNEYGLKIEGLKRPYAYVDHVWLKEIPNFEDKKRERLMPIVSFEISKDLATVWNRKKMIGDIENLRLSGCVIGVLVIPTTKDLVMEEKNMGNARAPWVNRTLPIFIQSLKTNCGLSSKLEVWQFDQNTKSFALYP